MSSSAADNEPLLQKDRRRYALSGILYPQFWEMYKKAESTFWKAEEIDLVQDVSHYNNKLNDNERHFINMVLAFFATADGIVNENVQENFLRLIHIPEIKYFYGFQLAMENIHAETYALLIDTYIKDAAKKDELFNAIDTVPCISKKAQWALRWIGEGNVSKENFAELLVAFACVEGIFFSGSFCAIFWLKQRALMPGLCFSNELISRDEGLHQEFACLFFSQLQPETRCSSERVLEIVQSAVEIEHEFITDALPVRLIGMNADLMKQYIEFVADRLLIMLGMEPHYNSTNPFDWMTAISLQGKTNFFEKRVGEYAQAGIGVPREEQVFRTDADF